MVLFFLVFVVVVVVHYPSLYCHRLINLILGLLG